MRLDYSSFSSMGSLQTPIYVIANDGDLIINIFVPSENVDDGPTSIPMTRTVSMRVYSNILVQNSQVFHDAIKSRNFGHRNTLDIHDGTENAVKFWMEMLHKPWRVDHFYKADITFTTFCDVVAFGEKYKLDMLKMRVWWSLWLSSKKVENFAPGDVDLMLSLCQNFDHSEGFKALEILREERRGIMHPEIPAAYKRFPPVLGPSAQDFRRKVLVGERVEIQDHTVWGYSTMFEQKYGIPLYYSDFFRLVTTPFNVNAVPKIRSFAGLMRQETNSTFLSFCKMVDQIAKQKKIAPLTRREMEAAWTWITFQLYDKQFVTDAHTDKATADLHSVLRMRFHPKGKVEGYWQERKELNGWTDQEIVRLEDGCDEPEEIEDVDEDDTMEGGGENVNNEDEDEDVVMLDLEEQFGVLGVGLTVAFLES